MLRNRTWVVPNKWNGCNDDSFKSKHFAVKDRPDAFKVLVDHFRSDAVNTKRHDDVKMTMRSFYERKVCLLNDGRSICEWLVVTNLFYNSSIRLLLQTANLALHWLKEYVINWLSESTIHNSNKISFLIFQKNWPNLMMLKHPYSYWNRQHFSHNVWKVLKKLSGSSLSSSNTNVVTLVFA